MSKLDDYTLNIIMHLKNILIMGLMALGILLACSEIKEIDTEIGKASYAFPLINTELGIRDITDQIDNNTEISEDQNGEISILFNGSLTRRDARSVFPPFLGIIDVPILDSVVVLELPTDVEYVTSQLDFDDTHVDWLFVSSFEEEVVVTVTFPDILRDGETFSYQYTIPPSPNEPISVRTPEQSLKGWTLHGNVKYINFEYDARLPSGERVLLDQVFFGFDALTFQYIEGFFGQQVFDNLAGTIDIEILDNWERGGIDFDDPKVFLFVDNSFGFPVSTLVRTLELEAVDGTRKRIESEFVDNGININFPGLDQVGEQVTTSFTFDKNNSNVGIVFNEKTSKVHYDIDALTFPENDPDAIGFVHEESFFLVRFGVELPMRGSISDLVMRGDVEINASDFDQVTEAEFKLITQNKFPIELKTQFYFIDSLGQVLDSLFVNGLENIPSLSEENSKHIHDPIVLDSSRIKHLKNAEKIRIRTFFTSTDSDQRFNFNAEDKLGIQLGVKVNVE